MLVDRLNRRGTTNIQRRLNEDKKMRLQLRSELQLAIEQSQETSANELDLGW